MIVLWSRKRKGSLHTSARGSKPEEEEVRLLIYGAMMRLIATSWLKIRGPVFVRSRVKDRDTAKCTGQWCHEGHGATGTDSRSKAGWLRLGYQEKLFENSQQPKRDLRSCPSEEDETLRMWLLIVTLNSERWSLRDCQYQQASISVQSQPPDAAACSVSQNIGVLNRNCYPGHSLPSEGPSSNWSQWLQESA